MANPGNTFDDPISRLLVLEFHLYRQANSLLLITVHQFMVVSDQEGVVTFLAKAIENVHGNLDFLLMRGALR